MEKRKKPSVSFYVLILCIISSHILVVWFDISLFCLLEKHMHVIYRLIL